MLGCVLALQDYVAAMEAGGQPKPVKMYTRANGQHVAQVVPATSNLE